MAAAILEMTGVCRLCLQKDNLLSVFKSQNYGSENLPLNDVIYITTGVQICTKDCITQKICEKCCQLSIKMHQFRKKSQENDQKLKEQWKSYIKLSNMSRNATVKNEPTPEVKLELKEEINEENDGRKVHPSVVQLYSTYKKILLPSIVLKSNMLPYVSMKMDEVETYYKQRNINMQQHVHRAMISYKKYLLEGQKHNQKQTIKTLDEKNAKKNKDDNIDKSRISQKNITNKLNKETTSKQKNSNASGSIDTTSQLDVENTKKRKSSITDSPIPEKKPALFESLGLTPTKIKEVPLLTCDICNSVHYYPKELKRHKLNHMRCQFCKIRFKSMERKNKHLEKFCLIKNTMNNLPTVALPIIELDLKVRRKYPDAFLDFPKISDLVDKQNTPHSSSSKNDTVVKKKEDSPDVIEILSDDESGNTDSKDANSIVSKPNPQSLVQNNNSNSNYNTNNNMSSSIVRPDIIIKNVNILNLIDSKSTDLEVLKHLLKHYVKIQIFSDKSTQTELPQSSSIKVNPYECTAELENLKHQLHVFKVPVEIEYGLSFQVSYNYENPKTTNRKYCVWNDLKPIDIKIPIQSNLNSFKPNESSSVLTNFSDRNTLTMNSTSISSSAPLQTMPTASQSINGPSNMTSQLKTPIIANQNSPISNRDNGNLNKMPVLSPLTTKPSINNNAALPSTAVSTPQYILGLGNNISNRNGYVRQISKTIHNNIQLLRPTQQTNPSGNITPTFPYPSPTTTQTVPVMKTVTIPRTNANSFSTPQHTTSTVPVLKTISVTVPSAKLSHFSSSQHPTQTVSVVKTISIPTPNTNVNHFSTPSQQPTQTNSSSNMSFCSSSSQQATQTASVLKTIPTIPSANMNSYSTLSQRPSLQINTFQNSSTNPNIPTVTAPSTANVNSPSSGTISNTNFTYPYTSSTLNQTIGSSPVLPNNAPKPGSIRVKDFWQLQ